MIAPVSRKSSSSKPRIVIAGVPMRTPDATVGGRSSNGTVLRLTVMRTSCSRSSAALPVHSELRRSICIRCVSVPPVTSSRPPACSVSASVSAFVRICCWYSRNAADIAILKHVAFAAIVCSSGPPCMPGKTARSTATACSSRQRMKPARGPASVLCVVDVTKSQCSTGFGCRPAATRPAKCAMSQSRSAPTSSAISRNLSVSTVRGYAEPPQTISFGRHSFASAQHLVVVDRHRLARHAVARDRVEPAAEVHLQPVREMAAVIEPQREDRVPRLQRRHVDRHVRRRARVGLHVRVLGAEELLRAVDRELLDLVDDLAAAVVALARDIPPRTCSSARSRPPRAPTAT